MAARVLTDVVTIVRSVLKDASTGGDFTDAEINVIVQQVVEEVSQRSPNIVREVLTTTLNSRELDISAIEDLINIEYAEYPTGSDPRDKRNVIEVDRETVEIDTTLTPIAGGSGHLTGTVTFTSGSTAVTGVATLFTTELEADYHIKVSTGTRWYRIASITDATNLVLAEVCRSDDDGADTVNVTDYCYETAYLYCAKIHTLSTTSTLNKAEEKVVIDGSVACTALAYIGKLRENVSKAVSLIGTSDNAIIEMSGEITKAIADLTSGRSQIADERTNAKTAIDKVGARINQALTDLELGRTYINKVNYGGAPESDYGNYASRGLQVASEDLRQAGAYLNQHSTSGRYGDYSARDLSVANGYFNKAGNSLRELTSRLSIAGVINSYQTWANNQLALYKRALVKIERPRIWREYLKD
uniref:Uncharacterized protein n=1 Tax=viral metagenome TaxID=1070528 RepID=A0A6M3J7C2_9ZZZZ